MPRVAQVSGDVSSTDDAETPEIEQPEPEPEEPIILEIPLGVEFSIPVEPVEENDKPKPKKKATRKLEKEEEPVDFEDLTLF